MTSTSLYWTDNNSTCACELNNYFYENDKLPFIDKKLENKIIAELEKMITADQMHAPRNPISEDLVLTLINTHHT